MTPDSMSLRRGLPFRGDKVHELGLRVLIDPWGNGTYFGGEQVSKFLHVQPAERCSAQLTRPDGTVVAEAPYDRPQTSVLTVPREKTAAPRGTSCRRVTM